MAAKDMSQHGYGSNPRNWVTNPCHGEHDISVSAETCAKCAVNLCALCGSDRHFTADGHDLSRPQYWGV